MKRTVLFLQNGSGIGGSGWSLHTLVTHLPQERYVPIVCSTDEGTLVERLRLTGIRTLVEPLNLFGYHDSHRGYSELIANPSRRWKSIQAALPQSNL